MKEELQQALQLFITKSLEAFECGAEFLSGGIPDVINQLLLWNLIEHASVTLFALILGISLIIIDYKFFRYFWDKNCCEYGWEEKFILGYILLGSIPRGLLWVLVIYMWNITWLKIIVAPKLYLIEYAANLIK